MSKKLIFCTFTLLVILCCFVYSLPAKAALPEFTIYKGTLQKGTLESNDEKDGSNTFVAQLEYRQELKGPFSFSIFYINEGHLRHHLRDGYGLQAWVEKSVFSPRFSLAFGIGPYYYYDDQFYDDSGEPSDNVLGWGLLSSVEGKWYVTENWFVKGRVNYVSVPKSVDTQSILFGVGRNLTAGNFSGATSLSGKNQLSILYNNDFLDLEARRVIWDPVEISISCFTKNPFTSNQNPFIFHNEYSKDDGRKIFGTAAQGWLVHKCFNDKFKPGIGIGPFYDLQHGVSGIVTMMLAYRIGDIPWIRNVPVDVVIQWYRLHLLACTDHRDVNGRERSQDVSGQMMGVGFSF